MSSTQFGDGTTFGTGEAPSAPTEPQPVAPLQPIPPLNQVGPPAPELAAPVPAEPATGVPVADMRDVPLGTLVFRAGLLPEERLEEALHEGMKTGRRLGEILLERGWVSENDLGRLLAAQKGLPFVELDSAAIDPTAPPLLHPEKARLHGALPIGFQDGVPVVAVADPSNDLVVENVRRALACEPFFVVAGRDALARMIEHVYGSSVEAEGDASAGPVAGGAAEGVTTSVEEPASVAQPAVPAGEPAAAAVPPVEPAAPVPETPTTPPVAEPVSPALTEPSVVQPAPNGHGLWLGETASEPLQQPVQPAEPVMPATPVEPTTPVEPVQPVAPVAPTTPVEPAQAVAAQPQPEFAVPAPPVAEPVASAPPEPEREAAATWSVVLRLTDGERIEVAAYGTEAEAMEGARSVVAQIAAESSWPFFAGRFLRPDTIVSVDLVQEDGDRWLGSSSRAAAWTQQQPAG